MNKYLSRKEREHLIRGKTFFVGENNIISKLLDHTDAADEMLAAKDAEVARLRDVLEWTNTNCPSVCGYKSGVAMGMQDVLSKRDEEIARFREALNWISDPRLHSMHGDPQSLMEKARAALEGKHG